MHQASPAHAQCDLLVEAAGLVDGGGQSQAEVGHALVPLSMLSERVAHSLREGQPEGDASVTPEPDQNPIQNLIQIPTSVRSNHTLELKSRPRGFSLEPFGFGLSGSSGCEFGLGTARLTVGTARLTVSSINPKELI